MRMIIGWVQAIESAMEEVIPLSTISFRYLKVERTHLIMFSYYANTAIRQKEQNYMSKLYDVTQCDRLSQLMALRDKLAIAIDVCESMRDLAALSKQYRETLSEIENIKGVNETEDELGEILSRRSEEGKSNTVR